MTSDEPALIAAILADPAEDTPRLAYADWLDEQTPPQGGCTSYSDRAEFIRVQVELAILESSRGEPVGDTPQEVDAAWKKRDRKIDELRHRERELWHQLPTDRMFTPPGFNIGVINANGSEFGFEGGGGCRISRGFVSALTCSWSDWSQHADAILARQPVERVKLTTMPMIWDERDPNCFQNNSLRPYPQMLKITWPRIEFELPPERTNSANWQFNLDLAAAENR